MTAFRKVVALSGGVGGARMLEGLARVLPAPRLTAIVNTGDDFEHWGLHIAPDLDTVMYTLSGLGHPTRGWGLAEETFAALSMVERYGGESWFALGDRDLGTHLVRTEALRKGEPLSAITARLFSALGVAHRVLPMTDGHCRTLVDTRDGRTLSFQDWLVKERAQPAVAAIHHDGCPPPAPGVLAAIDTAELVVICPSNPYVSIDPILELPGVRDAVSRRPTLAVSPIVKGHAVKGPLAEMIRSLDGREASASAVAKHYGGLVDAMVVEQGDEVGMGLPVLATATVMGGPDDRARLARELLAFAETFA